MRLHESLHIAQGLLFLDCGPAPIGRQPLLDARFSKAFNRAPRPPTQNAACSRLKLPRGAFSRAISAMVYICIQMS